MRQNDSFRIRLKYVVLTTILPMLVLLFFTTGMAAEISSDGLSVSLNENNGALKISSVPENITFETKPASFKELKNIRSCEKCLQATAKVEGSSDPVLLTLKILNDHEVSLSLKSNGTMTRPVPYPSGIIHNEKDHVVLPLGTGVIWPVILPKDENPDYLSMKTSMFWSRNMTMGFWTVLRGEAWLDLIPEDASDAALSALRNNRGDLSCDFYWYPEKGQWGYERKMRFIIGSSGGVTAACKAYREYRKPFGFGKTLLKKSKQAPQILKMAGAANIWLWHDRYEDLMYERTTDKIDVDNTAMVERVANDLKSAGCDRILWGIFFCKDAPMVKNLRNRDWLVTKYDNYTDVMPPALQKVIPAHRVQNCDFTERRNKNWPNDILVMSNGKLAPCWTLYGTDGKKHNQNAMCPKQAEKDIRAEVPALAKKWGYNAWFIDVMGGGLRECFSKDHPMTRRESRKYQLNNFSALLDNGLISGTEEGVECFLPGLCYTEGKMSVFPYRIDPSMCWRWKSRSFSDSEKSAYLDRYMLNPKYRVPMWELVWHECSVNYWYWGDASNNVPNRLKQRDLFNALYGTPPLYSFRSSDWDRVFSEKTDPKRSDQTGDGLMRGLTLREQVINSWRRATPVARKTAFVEMKAFHWLTGDRKIQRTIFADGTIVTANFSDKPVTVENKVILPWDYYLSHSQKSVKSCQDQN